jgi:hypothetical protein
MEKLYWNQLRTMTIYKFQDLFYRQYTLFWFNIIKNQSQVIFVFFFQAYFYLLN